MTIRDRIKILANSKGMSLPNVEVELNFGNGTILKWDKNIPNADKLSKVADYFNVSVDYLLGREEKSNNLDQVYFILAKEAQESGIDPYDIRLALEIIKRLREKK